MHLIIDLLLQLHIPHNGKCYVSFFQLIKGHDGETLPLYRVLKPHRHY